MQRKRPMGCVWMVVVACVSCAFAADPQMHEFRTPDGVRYAVWGEKPASPAPTLFIFGQSLEEMRSHGFFTEIGRILAPRGFIYVTLDPPGHGEDAREGEPGQLSSWNYRVNAGEPLFETFTARASAVLDHLVGEGYTDASRVAACGNSRGGFLALRFAAAEPRIRAALGFSPVTDLLALSEFSKSTNREAAQAMSAEALVPKLAGRPVYVTIGNRDARVGTGAAIAFATKLVAASLEGQSDPKAVVPVTLVVGPSPGHGTPRGAHAAGAAWLLDVFAAPPPTQAH